MTRREGLHHDVDMLAVRRDDELLDALGARVPGAVPDGRDPAVRLLAALATDVDVALDEELAAPLAARLPVVDLRPQPLTVLPARARPTGTSGRHTGRLVVAAMVAVGMLSLSGVAAAVSGDPFSPYKRVVKVVTGSEEAPEPEPASPAARAHRELSGVRAAIKDGDLAGAQGTLATLKASLQDLSPAQRRSVEAQIAALEARLAVAVRTPAEQTGAVQTPDPEETGEEAAEGGKPIVDPTPGGAVAVTPTSGPTARPTQTPSPRSTRTRPVPQPTPTEDDPSDDLVEDDGLSDTVGSGKNGGGKTGRAPEDASTRR